MNEFLAPISPDQWNMKYDPETTNRLYKVSLLFAYVLFPPNCFTEYIICQFCADNLFSKIKEKMKNRKYLVDEEFKFNEWIFITHSL